MVSKLRPLFTTWQWLTIVGGMLVTIVSWTAFAFQTFEQKSDLQAVLSTIRDAQMETNNRLGRIEAAVK